MIGFRGLHLERLFQCSFSTILDTGRLNWLIPTGAGAKSARIARLAVPLATDSAVGKYDKIQDPKEVED